MAKATRKPQTPTLDKAVLDVADDPEVKAAAVNTTRPVQLRQIAEQIRAAPQQYDGHFRQEVAARLFVKAIDLGAFAEARYASLHALIEHQREQHPDDWRVGVLEEATHWFHKHELGLSKVQLGSWRNVVTNGCELLACALEAQAERMKSECLLLDVEHRSVIINGSETYGLMQDQTNLIKALIDAKGGYVRGRDVKPSPIARIDRVIRRLPQAVQACIETKPGVGSRLLVQGDIS